MKVRFKIRVETGRKAAALNAQQAEAIKELLQWARQHKPDMTLGSRHRHRRRPGRARPGRRAGPDLHPGPAGPGRLAEPAVPLLPGLAARRAGTSPGTTGTSNPAAWTWRPAARARPGSRSPPPGIPRDGGMADLLTEAKAPLPRFAAVVCEDIERSAPGHLQRAETGKGTVPRGHPAVRHRRARQSSKAINATTVLVRRVKQGVAEWFRLQLKEKAWKGLQEHSLAGWNIGTPPYGYLADRIPHPAPAKAAQGRTKTRLILDPGRAPVVGQIYTWRTVNRLSVRAITARLNADPAAYPTPDGKPGWTVPGVAKILANPKYTGHMVYGRTRTTGTGRARPVPPDQWIWTPEPTHPAIIDRATWDAAQKIGAERGNIRDPETPAARPGRRYILRSRIRHNACQRRMCGTWRTSSHRPRLHLLPLPPRPGQPPPRRRPPRPRHGRPQRRPPSWPPSPPSSTSTSSATTAPPCSPTSSPPPPPSTPQAQARHTPT